MTVVRVSLWIFLALFFFLAWTFFRGVFWISAAAFALATPWLMLLAVKREEDERFEERLRRLPRRKRARVRRPKSSFFPPRRWRQAKDVPLFGGDGNGSHGTDDGAGDGDDD
ncbi:MAG: hypothetical protein ACRDI3_01550 [Actinomycetota bacterium]